MDGMKLILGLGISGLSCANYFDKKNVQYRIFDTRNISDIDQLFISSLDKNNL
jgi:UDP-N-acetylmuramoylalanine-D-glutamate ligase